MEIDLTVLLNLKCEETQEIGTTFMAQTKIILKFRELSTGVEFNSPSIHANLIKVKFHYFMVRN